MNVMDDRMIRDEKVVRLKNGCSAYAETAELIRLIKRSIVKENLHVIYDYTETGCWFIPVQEVIAK